MTRSLTRAITPELRDVPLTWLDECKMHIEDYCLVSGSQLARVYVERYRMTSSCSFNRENGRCPKGFA